jgi:HK97 family phage major capsid protein
MTRLNTWQRRALAARGLDPAKVGVPMNNGAVPATVAEWTNYMESLDTPEKFTAAFKDGSFKNNLSGYVAAQNKERTDLLAQLKEQTQAQLVNYFKENEVGDIKRINLDNSQKGPARHTVNNPRAVGAPFNGKFESAADFFQAVWSQGNGGSAAVRNEKLSEIKNYMQEKVPGQGGFLVPEEFRSEILRISLESSIVRPRARVIPMGSKTLSFPMIDSTSNVSSVYGGIVAYWTEEGADLTASEPTFGRVKLEAAKLTAYAEASNELVSDWGAFGVFLDEIFPEAVAHYEDLAYIGGNGVGQPKGALHSSNTALIDVAKETGQEAATIGWQNVIKMYARMLPSSVNRAVWLASPDTFAELATMALSVGTGGSAVWLTDARGTPVLTLLGRPIIMTEKAPAALGTVGDLSFVDFGMYLIGDRQSMSAEYSSHFKFGSDKTAFRIISRTDGRPWLQSAITPANNSATLSPFIRLATRA